jgi:hypothetical protein
MFRIIIAMANSAVDMVYSPEINNTIEKIISTAVPLSLGKFFILEPFKIKRW